MIHSKAELKEYLECDKKQLGITRSFPRPFLDDIWKYEITLRKYEYWLNKSGMVANVMAAFFRFKHHRNSFKLGIGIGPNVCGKGLCITHINGIQINSHAIVGENLRIQECVTVGGDRGGYPLSETMCFWDQDVK